MITETLTALARAGQDALQGATGLTVAGARAAHVAAAAITGPYSGVVAVRNSTVARVYVGCDDQLGAALARRCAPHPVAGLLAVFARALAPRLPTPRAIAKVAAESPGEVPVEVAGPGCFTLEFSTSAGVMQATATIFGRGVYEAGRATAFADDTARRIMSVDLATATAIDTPTEVDRFLSVARTLECDLQIEAEDGLAARAVSFGVPIGKRRFNEGGGLLLSVDAEEAGLEQWLPGRQISVSCGLQGRMWHWRSRVLEVGLTVPLTAQLELPTLAISAPSTVDARQRRREFRIALPRPLAAWVAAPTELDQEYEPDEDLPAHAIPVEVIDLSFSGAGLLGGADLAAAFPVDSLIEIWCDPLANGALARLTGTIRQCQVILSGRNAGRTRLGVEYLTGRLADRRGQDLVTRYILAAQRDVLASRAKVPAA